jgi:membrane protein involved in colicin uptake
LNINSKVDSTLGKMSPGEREIAIERLSAQAEEDRKVAEQAKKDKAAADAEQAKQDEETRRAVAEAKKNATT